MQTLIGKRLWSDKDMTSIFHLRIAAAAAVGGMALRRNSVLKIMCVLCVLCG
jgi:hypothetical protein